MAAGSKLYRILAPFALLYGLGAMIRNLLFDWQILPSVEYPVPVISVGNLAVGGTGKTPHTEYLIRLLQGEYKVAVLSRGYKRQSNGFVLAGETSTARVIGDEAYQLRRKFPRALIAVDSSRRRGIDKLLALPEDKRPDIILLDDAFQHRWITPSLSIVLTDYNRLFYKDMLMPAGFLREPAVGRHRADALVVTKCPDNLHPIDFRIIEDEIGLLPHQHLFFTGIVYGAITPVFPAQAARQLSACAEVLALAGIAAPDLFIREAEKRFTKVTALVFPDHCNFDRHDIQKIQDVFSRMTTPDKFMLVTEKDAARLQNNSLVPDSWKEVLYYLPVSVAFCTETALSFDDWVKNHIITFHRSKVLH
jgi:tetraacyldisaccharide 4'-kinase